MYIEQPVNLQCVQLNQGDPIYVRCSFQLDGFTTGTGAFWGLVGEKSDLECFPGFCVPKHIYTHRHTLFTR